MEQQHTALWYYSPVAAEGSVAVFEDLSPVMTDVCGGHQLFLVGTALKLGGMRRAGRSLSAISCITDKALRGPRSMSGSVRNEDFRTIRMG